MATHLVLQASGAMFETLSPKGWTFCFGVFVCDNEGTPVEGLKKANFSVWQLTSVGEPTLSMVTELGAEIPSSKMVGIYRLQTKLALGLGAPQPQQFVFAIRASQIVERRRPAVIIQGFTTVPITYLGDSH
ncbi:MAG TPA: hypothetical protein VFR51_08720 [Pyrinomonadaceae bacterium]|nr:hypothetical protein [Pyrinomonadaceae bacterium]